MQTYFSVNLHLTFAKIMSLNFIALIFAKLRDWGIHFLYCILSTYFNCFQFVCVNSVLNIIVTIYNTHSCLIFLNVNCISNQLCGLVVRVLGYRSGGPGSIPGTTRKKSSESGMGSTQPCEYN
jgi:hypothetical protein